MDKLYVVILGTVALAVACISFSTWTTVGDLRQIVRAAEATHPHGGAAEHHDWHEFASRAMGHIEHLPYEHSHADPVVRRSGNTGACLTFAVPAQV